MKLISFILILSHILHFPTDPRTSPMSNTCLALPNGCGNFSVPLKASLALFPLVVMFTSKESCTNSGSGRIE